MKKIFFCGLLTLFCWLSAAVFASDSLYFKLDMAGNERDIVSAIGGKSKYQSLEKYTGEITNDDYKKIIAQMSSPIMVHENKNHRLQTILFIWIDGSNQSRLGTIKQWTNTIWQIDFNYRSLVDKNLTANEQLIMSQCKGGFGIYLTKKAIAYYSQNKNINTIEVNGVNEVDTVNFDMSSIVFTALIKDVAAAYKEGWEPGFSEQLACFTNILAGKKCTLQYGERDGSLITQEIKPDIRFIDSKLHNLDRANSEL